MTAAFKLISITRQCSWKLRSIRFQLERPTKDFIDKKKSYDISSAIADKNGYSIAEMFWQYRLPYPPLL